MSGRKFVRIDCAIIHSFSQYEINNICDIWWLGFCRLSIILSRDYFFFWKSIIDSFNCLNPFNWFLWSFSNSVTFFNLTIKLIFWQRNSLIESNKLLNENRTKRTNINKWIERTQFIQPAENKMEPFHRNSFRARTENN